jgi:hypothetical protein
MSKFRWKLSGAACAALCWALGSSAASAQPVRHVPEIGVDTAGTYLTRNQEFNGLGWEFPAFRDALNELGVSFLVDHYLEIHTDGTHENNYAQTVADFQSLAGYLQSDGKEVLWNLEGANWRESDEYVPGENLYEPEAGLHYLKVPKDLMAALQKIPEIKGVCYDEIEHMQLNNNRFIGKGATGDVPAFADTTALNLPEAYALMVEKLKTLKAYYGSFGKLSVAENVWPVTQHIFARAGWTISPKIMKEGWTPVPLAMALGAGVEYQQAGCDVWLNPDLWFCGHYPGHSTEELRSSLLAGHWIGASRVYVENLDYVNIKNPQHDPEAAKNFDYSKALQGKHHRDAHNSWGSLVFFNSRDKFTLTPYGEVLKWYTHEYKDRHPVPYTWRDARGKVAIVRFPDSCWGQKGSFFRDHLLGSKVSPSTPATEAWFSIWNQLSLGTIPKEGVSFHCKGVKYQYGPRFFCPAPPVMVFDHRVGNEHPDFDFRGAEVVFLTGVSITPETMAAVKQHVEKSGATAILLSSLAPDGFESSSRFFTVDSFEDPRVQAALKPVLPPEDEMQFLFGATEVVFRKIDRDRIQVFVDGKAVSPVIESDSCTSLGPDGTELIGCEDVLTH